MKTRLSLRGRASIVAALAIAIAGIGCAPKPPEHGTAFVIAVEIDSVPPAERPAAINRTQAALCKRMSLLEVPAFAESAGTNQILLKLPHMSDEAMHQARKAVQRNAHLEFRLVHPDTQSLVQQGLIPVGFELKKESRLARDGTRAAVPFVVSKQHVTNVSGANIVQALVTRGNLNEPQIMFRFDKPGTAAFAALTGENIGRQLAIFIDGELFSAPVIRIPITEGSGVISGGNMSESEARELAAALSTSLIAPITIVEEKQF